MMVTFERLSLLFLIGMLLFLAFTDSLTRDSFLGIVFVSVIMYYLDKKKKYKLTLSEIEKLAHEKAKVLQYEGRIRDGTIRILPESEIKNLVFVGKDNSEIIPYGGDVLIQVENPIMNFYYLLSYTIFGEFKTCTELNSRKSIKDVSPEFKMMSGEMKSGKDAGEVEKDGS